MSEYTHIAGLELVGGVRQKANDDDIVHDSIKYELNAAV
jgi:hypothetical protein